MATTLSSFQALSPQMLEAPLTNWNLYADLSPGGTIPSPDVAGTQPDQFLARVDSGVGGRWLLRNNQGSVRLVANASGSVIGSGNYDAFGNITSATNAGVVGTLLYNGYRWDAATGMFLAGRRYYLPQAQRWLTQDPTGLGPDGTPIAMPTMRRPPPPEVPVPIKGPVSRSAGGGAGLRYDTELLSPLVCNQEMNGSCQAANARQILRMAGVDVTEAAIRQIAPVHPTLLVTSSDSIAQALNQYHPTWMWDSGGILPSQAAAMSTRGPFMASINNHSVIVTKIENSVVHLIDPWGAHPGTGQGSIATMKQSVFEQLWTGMGVFPVSNKPAKTP